MTRQVLPPITTGKEEFAERVATVIGAAFAGDALNRAALLVKDDLPNDAVIKNETRVRHFLPGIKNKAETGGLLVEAANFAAVAVWIPPGVQSPPPDRGALSPLIIEYIDKWSEAKKRHLGGRNYWYLNYLGRHPERTEPGAVRALFEPYLQQAKEAGLPAWLEATNVHARDVYAHFGFKVVEEIVIGGGVVEKTGNRVPGGEGVVIYGMIVEP